MDAVLNAADAPGPGPRPELAWLPVDRLDVDEAYQRTIDRPASQRHIARIAANFRWAKFQVVIVMAKEGGRWEIIDGQHRVAAARAVGQPLVPAVVVGVTSTDQAAEIFASANRDRLGLSPQALFKGELLAGRPEAVELKRLADAAGLELLGYAMAIKQVPPGKTAAIPSLRRALKTQGAANLGSAIAVLMACWGRERGVLHGAFFEAAARFLNENGSAEELRRALEKLGPERWAATSPLGLGGSGAIPLLVAGLRGALTPQRAAAAKPLAAPEPARPVVPRAAVPLRPTAPPLKPKPAGPDGDAIAKFIAEKGVSLVQSPEQVAAFLRGKGRSAIIREGQPSDAQDGRTVWLEKVEVVLDGKPSSLQRLYDLANQLRAADGLKPLALPKGAPA